MEAAQTTHTAQPTSADVAPAVDSAMPEWLEARCPTCTTGLKWKVGATPEELERDGFTRGWSDDGLPHCPRCGTTTEPIEQKLAHEAIPEAAAALAGAAPQQLPFPAPAFDLNAALRLIAEKNREVQAARGEYEELKEQTHEARKQLDKESELLEKLIADLDARRRDAEDAASRPRLPLEACPYERETHHPCPICRAERRDTEPACDGFVHVDLNIIKELQGLVDLAGVWISPETVRTWTFEERLRVEAWAAATHLRASDHEEVKVPERPAVLGTPHAAAEASGDEQHCAVCGGRLPQRDENQVFALGEFVGTDCPGPPDAKSAA